MWFTSFMRVQTPAAPLATMASVQWGLCGEAGVRRDATTGRRSSVLVMGQCASSIDPQRATDSLTPSEIMP